MFYNYLKIAIRSIRRRTSYTIINVAGLALGVTCAILIFALVSYHLGFDNFHHNADRIYRVVTEEHRDEVDYEGSVPPAFAKAFRNDYTYGEKVAQVCMATDQVITIEQNGSARKFKEDVAFAESSFFEIFNFPLTATQNKGPLGGPGTAIVTERVARKYFGDETAIDKTFRFNNQDFRIAAILKDIPENTDLRIEIYLSHSDLAKYNPWYAADDSWGGITSDIQTFALLRPGVIPQEVENVLPAYVKKYRTKSKNVHHYKLQPLQDMHLDTRYGGAISKSMLLGLSVVGFLLIFTACLNFINLATAQVFNRAKEVGVRKVLGGVRTQLFWQFTSETGVVVVLSVLLAFCISFALLPQVNTLFATQIMPHTFVETKFLLFLAFLVIAVTLMAGAYPGLMLSGFRPVLALKARLDDSGSFSLRRILIIAQFAISQILLISLIVVISQMRYFHEADMGFDDENVVMIPIHVRDARLNTLKNEFQRLPHVKNVSFCFSAPASESNSWGTSFVYDNRTEMEPFSVSFKGADENYLSTFAIGLVAGRNLEPSDTVKEFLVNETLVAKLGITPEEILGRMISANGGSMRGPVVGVVSDFNDQSLRAAIKPVVITTSRRNYNECAVKIDMADASETMAAMEEIWSNAFPDEIYEYNFLDEQTAAFYAREQTLLKLVQVFSFIALFIGCLGLYGLVSFMAMRKTKEIGIRKVLGGSLSHILWIFGKEFALLLAVAFALAAPSAWWLMSRWLENYEYHITIGPWMLVIELAVISIMVMLTVGFKSARAALANPVDSLRNE